MTLPVRLHAKFLVLVIGILLIFFGILSFIIIQREARILARTGTEQEHLLARRDNESNGGQGMVREHIFYDHEFQRLTKRLNINWILNSGVILLPSTLKIVRKGRLAENRVVCPAFTEYWRIVGRSKTVAVHLPEETR